MKEKGQIRYKIYSNTLISHSKTDIKWPYTSAKEINKIIDSLKDKNSSGYDEITTKIIQISKPFIISPLINICNKMLAQGIYPERLKFSLINPFPSLTLQSARDLKVPSPSKRSKAFLV